MVKNDSRLKILVVEDETDSRAILAWLLRQAGYRISETADGQSAVELAVREAPDLILMDISLPGIDGLQAVREIRAALPARSTPIIAMSAYDRHEAREQALDAGCTDYAAKPLDLDKLEKMIARHLGKVELLPETAD